MVFDKIWCLSCCNKDRLEQSKKEFKKVGLNVEYYFNPKNPVTRWCPKYFVESDYYNDVAKDKKYSDVYESVLSCFVGHYNIIKTSYELGYNNILIMEDDIHFIDGVNLQKIFSQIPEETNIANFYNSWKSKKLEKYNEEKNFWRVETNYDGIMGSIMVFLDRKAMKAYLNIFENNGNSPIIADRYYQLMSPDDIKICTNRYNIIDMVEHPSLIEKKNKID